jgi:1-acyl-sn-glycerol-3-phosphate acyltransferase
VPALRGLYAVWEWLVVIPVLAVATAVFGTLAFLLAVVGLGRVGNAMGIAWSRAMALVTPMIVRVRGRENAAPGQSYVIVANHQSQYDIFALYGFLGLPFRWVMKAELRKVPFLGPSCYRLGHVFIDRRNRDAAWASIRSARERLRGGTSILFFPEGTRSPDGALLPFKSGAFRLAVEMGLPVLPVTLRGTRDVLPPRTLALFPGRAELRVHPPIAIPEGLDEAAAAAELSTRARAAIEAGLTASD